MNKPSLAALACTLLLATACNGTPAPTSPVVTDGVPVFSETEYSAGIIHAIQPGMALVDFLESPLATPVAGQDVGGTGYDTFKLELARRTFLDLCFVVEGRSHQLEILNALGTPVAAMVSSPVGTDCAKDAIAPVELEAGTYSLLITHDGKTSATQTLVVKLTGNATPSLSPSLSTRSAELPTDTETLTVTAPKEYDPAQTYDRYTVVSWKGTLYVNGWFANKGECPVEADCPTTFQGSQWKVYDPAVKHELAYYDHVKVQAAYPAVRACTAADYGTAAVQKVIDARAATGDISLAAPTDGFLATDLQALYREYMLPCRPDLATFVPENVATVKRVLPLATWNTFASRTDAGDSSMIYPDAQGKSAAWPAESGFVASAYDNFLKAVARYPYFCGEKGYFSSVDEACKREVASLLAHAAQETGNGDVLQSFYWLREYGGVNSKNYNPTAGQCLAPFDCTSGWASYYGRGPKQVSYYYNYAGFSAAVFNGNFNYLLKWPDMVAWDGELYFLSAIWFVMTNQPPKPSIHDIMIGRYFPKAACSTASSCNGIVRDTVTGVADNFNVTIEAVNGGVECRPTSVTTAAANAKKRSAAYRQALGVLGATLSVAEQALPMGCAEIASNWGSGIASSAFEATNLLPGLHTFIDMSESNCRAQAFGGDAAVSVTATGMVTACMATAAEKK